MIQELQLRILPEQAANEQSIKQYVAREKGLDVRTIQAVRTLKRSIDARQRTVFVNLTVRIYINELPTDDEYTQTYYPMVDDGPAVVVVGAGPGGLFAALRLIELGCRPIVVERGKDVHTRKRDIARISREHTVDPESNYSFGEGGAGAYSDGKLYTRSKKRGNVEKILNVFCQHGASTTILSDAHPHIGTDKLPRVIENMRETIRRCGGEVHFETRMDRLIVEKGQIVGIETHNGRTFRGSVILATGHSARDVYRHLCASGIDIEAKGIAVGVRLEHPAELIDQIQYHNKNGRGRYLPAAEYSFVTQVEGRGVYSFCMCPGGAVVPAASGPEQIVVNGMSASHRGSRWSNSGMVVEIRPEDIDSLTPTLSQGEGDSDLAAAQDSEFKVQNSLKMLHFQEELERQCWMQGNRRQTAPAQRMVDFTRKKLSYDLPSSSYSPGLISSPLHFWMPEFISSRLQRGFEHFGRTSRGFLTNEATVIGVETRTSAPVRIIRNRDTLQHITVSGLFPCGEGAGYAGGIVSAAIDGERCAEAAAEYVKSTQKRSSTKLEIKTKQLLINLQ
ncbi:MAG: NAD(P)/FAD-dependent oxidoreductase [Bacteroidaceae bacterium]|nr:NAD(P)/FAD-dependent oxidoreductase [Bacteroidaceae bacterium]